MVPGGVHLFITDDDWQWMMNINALGTMHMMQAAATRMRDTGRDANHGLQDGVPHAQDLRTSKFAQLRIAV